MSDGVTGSTDQFLRNFHDEKATRKYLEARCWNGNVVCPCCGSVERIQTTFRKQSYK